MSDDTRSKIIGVLRPYLSTDLTESLADRLLDILETHVDNERQFAWDAGYDVGLSEAENQDRYEEGYDDGYTQAEIDYDL